MPQSPKAQIPPLDIPCLQIPLSSKTKTKTKPPGNPLPTPTPVSAEGGPLPPRSPTLCRLTAGRPFCPISKCGVAYLLGASLDLRTPTFFLMPANGSKGINPSPSSVPVPPNPSIWVPRVQIGSQGPSGPVRGPHFQKSVVLQRHVAFAYPHLLLWPPRSSRSLTTPANPGSTSPPPPACSRRRGPGSAEGAPACDSHPH